MSPRTRRRSSVALAMFVAFAVLATGCLRNPESQESANLVNNERRNRGIPELALSADLIAKAQGWADHMAARGSVSHSNLREGVDPQWRVLGENVGWARSTGEMHSMFMASAPHRSTMLDRRYRAYGVGVAVVNGRFFTVHVFAG
jgi:uncharacterized protein YkwD